LIHFYKRYFRRILTDDKVVCVMIAFKVSEVFSPDNFFIQKQDELETLDKFLTDLSRYYIRCELERRLDELRVPPTSCQLGMWVAAVWEEDNYWYRAKIIKITSLTTVEIQFVDFGNRMSCKKSELYELVEPFRQNNFPAFSSQAKLSGIKPAGGKKFSKAASDFFQKLTHDTGLVGQVVGSNENGKLEVKLILKDGEIDIGDKLIKKGLAWPRIKEEARSVEKKFPSDLANMLDDLTCKLLNCKGQAETSGHVLAAFEGLQEEMNELRSQFQNVDVHVHEVIKKQVKLAKKLLIIGVEKRETQENGNYDNDDDPEAGEITRTISNDSGFVCQYEG